MFSLYGHVDVHIVVSVPEISTIFNCSIGYEIIKYIPSTNEPSELTGE
jgi:hypothetical protein